MTLVKMTGAQGYIKKGGVLWADADFNMKLSTGTASAPRTGKKSDFNAPGKLTMTLTAKNIQRNLSYMGGQLTAAGTGGTAGTIKSGITIAADGWTASTTPTIATASRVSLLIVSSAVSTGGTVTVVGTDANGNAIAEPIAIPSGATAGAKYYSSRFFKTAAGVYTKGLIGPGTLALASEASGSTYTVAGDPEYYDLEFGGIDSVSGNFMKAIAVRCFTKSTAFAAGDANKIWMDDVAFEIEDLDTGLSLGEDTTN